MKTTLLLILFSFSLSILSAQEQKNTKIDSLTTLLRKTKDNEQKIELYIQLNREYRGVNKDSSLVLSGKVLYLSKKIKNNQKIAFSHVLIGETYREMNNFPEARKHFDKALDIAPDDMSIIGDVYDNLGLLYNELKDSLNTINYYNKSLKARKKAGDEEKIAFSYYNIANFYYNFNKIEDAKQNYLKALPLFKKTKNYHHIAVTSANVGKAYSMLFQYQDAIIHLHEALKYYEETNNTEGILWMQHSIGLVYSDIGNFDKSEEFIGKFLKFSIENDMVEYEISAHLLFARMYIYSKQYDKAMSSGNKALEIAISINHRHFVADSYYYLAETNFFKTDYEEAVRLFLKALELASKNNLRFRKSSIYCPLGESYLKLNQLDKAQENLEIALRLDKEMGANLTTVYKSLAEVAQKSGDYKKAYEYILLSYDERDKFQRVEAKRLSVQIETDRKEKELRAEQAKKDKQNLKEVTEKKNQRNLAIVGLIFLSTLTLIILFLFRLRNKKIAVEKQNIELKQREIQAIKEKEAFKSRFLANISHEFRTPLTLIKGNTDVLKKLVDDKYQFQLNEINRNGEQLLNLINQLLDLSKMEGGEYSMNFATGNLFNDLIAHISAFNSYAEQENIRLKITTTEVGKTKLLDNSFIYSLEALQTIVNNLISNAIKFTPSGGEVIVTVDFQNETLTIKVTDSGPGIPEQHLEKIFDRFYQVEESYLRTQKGSGIGLSLVKEFAILHNGGVAVENNSEGGCSFTVWLKCEKSNSNDTINTVVQDYPILASNQTSSIETDEEMPLVLVVEDQPELRKFIIETIGENYNCIEASNGKIGLDLAQQYIPDLIISDVMMPEMDGFELCQKIKENQLTSHIPVILLTAKAGESDKLSGLEMGADDYILKPFSIDELKLKVRNAIRLLQLWRTKFKEHEEKVSQEPIIKLSQRDAQFIELLHEKIQQNISNSNFSVVSLAEEVHFSQSQLTRKLKAITGQNASELIKTTRLDEALRLLRENNNVADVCWMVGFEDSAYFGKAFKKHFGVAPSKHSEIN